MNTEMNQLPSSMNAPLVNQSVTSSARSDPEAFELTDVLRRWQPTGCKIIVNMPYASDNKAPLFAIAVNPIILHPQVPGSQIYNPIYPTPNTPIGPVTSVPAVTVVQYDIPPPLCSLALGFRFWSGTLHYRLRVTEGCFSQGYLITGIVKGHMADYFNIQAAVPNDYKLNSHYREVHALSDTFQSFMNNAYTMSDLSISRHVEVEVPYTLAYDKFDNQRYLSNMFVTEPTLYQPMDFLVVGARGILTPTTGTTQMEIEIEIAGGADFALEQVMNLDFNVLNKPILAPFFYPQFTPSRNKNNKIVDKSVIKKAKDSSSANSTAV